MCEAAGLPFSLYAKKPVAIALLVAAMNNVAYLHGAEGLGLMTAVWLQAKSCVFLHAPHLHSSFSLKAYNFMI